MPLRPSRPKNIEINVFDPAVYSNAENQFLVDHLGEPPILALRQLPPNVNPKAVKPLLDRAYELNQLQAEDGTLWAGVEAMKTASLTWLRENAKWKQTHARNRRAPRWPSLYSFDARGRAHKGAPGADSSVIRTYFNEKGERLRFEIPLFPENAIEWVAPGQTEQPMDKRLKIDGEKNRIECFCGHTESYKADSRSSFNAARARISKHLRTAKESVEDHREVHTLEFGGSDV
jgi:hypothetical protein